MNILKSFLTENKLAYIITILFASLLFIYPIPHTISIRYIIIMLLFLLSIYFKLHYTSNDLSFKKTYLFIPSILFVTLILWSIFVALFSHYSHEALNQIRSQLVMPILIGFITYVMASHEHKLFTKKRILTIVFFAIFIHVAYSNLESIKYFLEHKKILTRSPAMIGLDRLNFVTSFLLAILATEVFSRINKYKHYLPFDNLMIFFITIFVYYGFLVIQAKRLGITSILFLFGSITILTILENKEKFKINKKMFFLLFIFVIMIIGGSLRTTLKNDKRWNTLIETFPIAINTEKYSAWRGEEIPELLPKLSNGEAVSGSNYMRVAWITKSIKLIIENPFGYGYSKIAFRNILREKYPNEEIKVLQAHSGMADLGLSSGVVGMLLWIATVGYIIIVSVKNFYMHKSYFALLSFFICTGFSSRMFVDSIFRDQNLQQLIVILVLSLVFMQQEIKNKLP